MEMDALPHALQARNIAMIILRCTVVQMNQKLSWLAAQEQSTVVMDVLPHAHQVQDTVMTTLKYTVVERLITHVIITCGESALEQSNVAMVALPNAMQAEIFVITTLYSIVEHLNHHLNQREYLEVQGQ